LGRRCYLVYFLFVASSSSLCSSVAEQQRWCHCWSRAACHVVSTTFVPVNYQEMALFRKNMAVLELSALNWVSLPVYLLKWKVCNGFHTNVKSVCVAALCVRWQCCSRALGRGWPGSHPGRFALVKEPCTEFSVEAGWATEPIWTLGGPRDVLSLPGIETRFLTFQVTVLTALCRMFLH
jgi:hypothetical protein